jgi:hypothetical protein
VYASFQLVADPIGDAAAELLAQAPGTRRLLEAGLRRGPGARDPEPLQALLDEAWTVPAWVDFPRMLPGARLQQRLGRLGLMILGAWGLVNGYHSAPAVKPLMFTGQLDVMARRRLAETSHYVLLATADDGLRPGRPGWEASVRVRLMHSAVRRMIKGGAGAGQPFDVAAWGEPANQADLAGTLVEFSGFIILGARRLGIPVTQDEAEGLVHLWRYAGRLNGVHPRLLEEFSDAARLEHFAHLIKLIQPGPDDDSRALTHAMRHTVLEGAQTPAERRMAAFLLRFHDGLSWELNVDTVAADLEVPHRGWRHVVRAVRPVLGAVHGLGHLVPGWEPRMRQQARAAAERDVAQMLAGHGPDFQARRVRNATSH